MKQVVYIVIDTYRAQILKVLKDYTKAVIYKGTLIKAYPHLEIKKFEID